MRTQTHTLLTLLALSCCILAACGPEYQEEEPPGETSTSATGTSTTGTSTGCAELDADTCADTEGCTPEYVAAPCANDGRECPDNAVFVGCMEDPQDACSPLSEQACSQNPACQPIYGSDCGTEDRAPEAPGGNQEDPVDCAAIAVYQGCEEAPQYTCSYDGDCPSGQICYLEDDRAPEAPDCACAPCEPGAECPPCDCGDPEPGFVPSGYCGPAPSEDCYSDSDCAPNEYCNYNSTRPAPAPQPDEDTDCLCNCPDDDPNCGCDCGGGGAGIPASGVCEPREEPIDVCFYDGDCAPNEYCELNWDDETDEDCACPPCAGGDDCPPCDCGEGARPAPEGICLPRNNECYEDSDCQDGYMCAWLEGGEEPDFPDCDCACADDDPDCECGCGGMPEPWAGECIPAGPQNECGSDSDCNGGYCEITPTCDGPGCPPSEAYCVYPNCDEPTDVICDMIPPVCEEGTIVAIRNGCYECVDPRTCGGGGTITHEYVETSGHAQNTCAPNDGAALHIELHEPAWIEENQACSEFGQGSRLDLVIYDWEVLQQGGSIEVSQDPNNWMVGFASVCDENGVCHQAVSGEIHYSNFNTDDRLPYVHGSFFLQFNINGEEFSVEGDYDVDHCMNETFCG